MAKPILGILTLYLDDNKTLEERQIYQRMIAAGKNMGMEVFVFTPADVNHDEGRINALFYNPAEKTWSRKWTSFPHMIFDRCRIQKSHRFEQLRKFRSRYSHLNFLNRPLRNKWTVYKTLSNKSKFQDKQPLTTLYTSHKDLTDMLRKFPLVFLKPINGTGGRGILRIERHKDGNFGIQGRDQERNIIQPQKVGAAALQERLSSWNLGNGQYIVQQGIMIRLPGGRVHDYRLLVQKNGRGEWEPTGCAGRIGAAGSITSNLHGGGKAVMMEDILSTWIGDEKRAREVRRETERFGVEVAAYLEKQYDELCELALDIAIDRKGGIWLLEVNPKPAREVFRQCGDNDTYERAIVKPLEYAMHVYANRGKRSRSELKTADSDNQSSGNASAGMQTSGLNAGKRRKSSAKRPKSGNAQKPFAPSDNNWELRPPRRRSPFDFWF
ncbi:YheC/YheD family protein [Paenibacillus pasadenensis]|uniref:YheC/YheD family endospore coat-associated protein n=1 Tax=Paenibacillus pasadenensis TaxID=217090 RepID=UPI002041E53B|nr:YheC/YheD family protein [Paenibacillus pasadenensis]